MEDKQNPLVSVPVVTYNSAKTVIETLDSIYNQTYQNIELIISDDCSTDDTISICKAWIQKHKNRFKSVEVIAVSQNTGVTGNYSRAIQKCSGEWIKWVDGDDLLLPTCIEDNIAYVSNHPDAIIVFSRPTFIGIKPTEFEKYECKMFDYSFFSMTLDEQYERIKHASCLPSSTIFVNRKGFYEKGLFYDERIPMLEDRPLELNAIKKGVKLHFFNKQTAIYRVRKESLCNAQILSPRFYESTRLAYFYYVFDKYDQIDHDMAIKQAVDNEMGFYYEYYQLKQISQTKAYKIAKYISNPQLILHRIAQIFKNK